MNNDVNKNMYKLKLYLNNSLLIKRGNKCKKHKKRTIIIRNLVGNIRRDYRTHVV